MVAGTVGSSIESLCARFSPERAEGLDARFRIRVGNLVRDVVVERGTCRIERAEGRVTAEIRTAPATWLEMESGRLSGIEAFADRRLSLRGSIQSAILFEPLFERPDAGGLRYSVEDLKVGRLRISTFVAGSEDAEPLLLLHGLGATKASWLPVVPALAKRYRVIIPDLPGFGSSSKPMGAYSAPWFADRMAGLMGELGHDRFFVAGNSMGGRIAQEMGMMDGTAVRALACLCPANAFSQRPGLWLARLLRPELGFAVGRLPRHRVEDTMRGIFSKPSRIEDDWYDAAIDDFMRTWKSPRARMAFFASLRNIYLDEPHGERGFYTRLAKMETPAFYVYGRQDMLISSHFGKKIQRFLPGASVEVWDDCGHAPQLEHPDKTANALLNFYGRRTRSEQSRRKVRAS